MNMISLIAAVWTLLFLLMTPSNVFVTSYDTDSLDLVPPEFTYDRIGEINKQCGFVLDSATELRHDDSRFHTIKEELVFENGDWWQDLNGVPLLTFDDTEIRKYEHPSPSKLVSFGVDDVNRDNHSSKSIYVSGVMQFGISINGLYRLGALLENRRSYVPPSQSQLFVGYQGIYTESEENHGERVLCLLGSTLLPPYLPDSSLLVLRYPRKFTLRSGDVRGILKSLNNKSNHKYFDDVHISSRLGDSATYEFTADSLVSKACDPYPFKDRLVDNGVDLYTGHNFCGLLQMFTGIGEFTMLRNWKCNGTDDFCSKFGPFVFDKKRNTRELLLFIQDVRCDKMTFQDDNNIRTMRISLVLRALSPYEDQFSVVRRIAASNLTISAEGIWKSSSGQLCMVGCPGDGKKCDTRICLYLPLSFSLKQQSLILGTLSSLDQTSVSRFYPLLFENRVREVMNNQDMFWEEYIPPRPIFEYTKIVDAHVVLEKDNRFNLGNVLKRSLFGFPKIVDLQLFPSSVSFLAHDLTFYPSEGYVAMEINFIGPLFGRCLYQQNISSFAKENNYYFDVGKYTDKQLLLNVSGQLTDVPNLHTNFSSLAVEGVYDPLVGKMYLVGCQDSLDCLVEVVISYPPTTARWLFKPRAWIYITSIRDANDPLYFQPIKLQTGPLKYIQGSKFTLTQRGLEGILSILTISLGISCILSQLVYVRDNTDSAPYVSLVMLGVQALGYSHPLITGAQVVFRKVGSGEYWQTSQWIRISDNVTKLLALAAFLLTMRLFHKVWKSRVRIVRRTLLDPERVPNEMKLYLATLLMYIIGCILYLSLHNEEITSEPPQSSSFSESGTESRWIGRLVGKVEEYLIMVQDLFLVPQVIANLLWRIDCKPLRKFYYVGTTFVLLVPRIYYRVNPGYFLEQYAVYRPQFDFFSMFGDMAIPVAVVFVVYVQQRWSYEKLSEAFTGENSKFKIV